MYDINSKGTIYFGTKLENIYVLDKETIYKPFVKNEKYLSVSVSSYKGKLPITCHEEISFLSEIFTTKYRASIIDDKSYLNWNLGYKNSITYIDGFGPNNNKFYNKFGNEMANNRMGQNIATIINKTFTSELVNINKLENNKDLNQFEYLSTSLHPFINKISPDMIIGWIADSQNIEKLRYEMERGYLTKRNLYLVDEI